MSEEKETLEEMLIRHEGKKNKPYRCPAGYLTIGVGHNIDAKGLPEEMQKWVDMHGYLPNDLIMELLDMDIEDALNDAWDIYPALETFSESRRNALIDFLFNVGKKTAMQFIRTNNHINNGHWDKAAESLLKSKYATQVGKRAQEIAQMLREG